MERTASLKVGSHISSSFDITNGMPQGSPLSPILSALYTASLLELAETWKHWDLTLYVDDGAILAISATAATATEFKLAIASNEISLKWLSDNGLSADPAKTKLMTFTKGHQPDLTGG